METVQISVSDTIPTPRGSSECRLNAQRGRQEHDWFSHQSTSSSSNLRPPSARTSRPTSPTYAAGLSSLQLGTTATPRRTYFKAGENSENWFKYGADFKDEVIGKACRSHQPRGTLGEGSEVKKKMTQCDSNTWFRHNHSKPANNVQQKRQPRSVLASESPNSPWSEVNKEDNSAAKPSPRPETAEYMKRHKGGKSNEWFSHEQGSAVVDTSPTSKGSKESAQNAAKMKGDPSQNWFNHDPNDKYVEPKPMPKLTTPEAKLLMERSKGDEMKKVFRMDKSLEVTFVAPSESVHHNGEAKVEGQTLVEKFLQQNPPINGVSS